MTYDKRNGWTIRMGCDLLRLANPSGRLVRSQARSGSEIAATPSREEGSKFAITFVFPSERFFERCLNTPERRMWLKSGCMWLDFQDITQTNREAVLSKQLVLAQDRLLFPERNVYQTSFEQVNWRNYRSTSRWLDTFVCVATCALVLYWHSARGFVMGMPKRFQMMGLEE